MRKTFCILALLIAAHSGAQSVETLLEKAEAFGYKQLDSAIYYWEKGGDLALTKGQDELAIAALEQAAGSHLFLDNHERAVSLYRKIYPILKTDAQRGNALNGMSHQYVYDRSFKPDSIFQQAINIGKETKDTTLLIGAMGNQAVYLHISGDLKGAISNFLDVLNYRPAPLQELGISCNLAHLFLVLDNPERAKEYIDRGIAISEENNYRARYQRVAILNGRCYRVTGQLELAEQEFRLVIDKNEKNLTSSVVDAYLNLARIRLAEGNIAEAERMLQKSRDIKVTDEFITLANHDRLEAQIALAKGNVDKAEKIVLKISKDLKNAKSNVLEGHVEDLLSRVYEAKGELKKALFHYRNYKTIADSIALTNQAIQIFEQESKYKRKQQEDAITFLDQQNQIQALKLSEKNRIIIFGGIGLLIFSILSFFLYRFYQQVKQQRNIIKSSLDEKEMLLREIHHRVKNNLQMVSSLLSLQSRYIKDEAALEAIQQSKSRVRSMALIHQDLYSHENLKGVGVKEFLHKLCGELYSAYNISKEKIQLSLNIEDINLDVDSMIPIGLIINELVANALKYAFPEGREGEIKIDLKQENQELILTVADNGVGFDFNLATNKSFGYKLINTLSKRLRGKLAMDTANGSKITIHFSKYKILAA